MSLVRVDVAALAAVAGHMQPLGQWLATAGQQIATARSSVSLLGDPAATAQVDELLRQLGILVEMEGQLTVGLTRSLRAAAGDYGTAEDVVVRFDA